MHTLTINENRTPQTVKASTMQIGELARIEMPQHLHNKDLIVRTYSNFVSLDDFATTWSQDTTLNVIIIPKATVTLKFDN